MKHKCDGCFFKREHQEMGFKSFGICTFETDLIKAQIAYNATDCPFFIDFLDAPDDKFIEELSSKINREQMYRKTLGIPAAPSNFNECLFKLINRQKAEIEKIKTQLGKRENFFTIKLEKEQLNDIVKSQFEKFEVDAVALKNETIREFAEKLKREIDQIFYETATEYEETILAIDIVAKEMTEDLQ